MKLLLLLSGPSAVGKSTLASILCEEHGFARVSTSQYLRDIATSRGASKGDLQALGDALDENTDYAWVITEVAKPILRSRPSVDRWLVDSVRKRRQVALFKESFGLSVFHVHLTAPETLLRSRYEARTTSGDNVLVETPYEEVAAHPNELESRGLIQIADLVFDLSKNSVEHVVQRIVDAATARISR